MKLAYLQFIARSAIDGINLPADWNFVRSRLERRRYGQVQAGLRFTNRAHPGHFNLATGASGKVQAIQREFFCAHHSQGGQQWKARELQAHRAALKTARGDGSGLTPPRRSQ